MKPFKIQNRTSEPRRVKFIKHGGVIGFPKGQTSSYVENSREGGFCLSPISPLQAQENPKDTITLTAHPMGVDGRVSLFINDVLIESKRYSGLSRIADRQAWFNTEFGAFVTYSGKEKATFTVVTGASSLYRFVFEDDDLDYIFSGTTNAVGDTNPTLIVEQYRLAFDLMKKAIDCTGALNRSGILELDGSGPFKLTLSDGSTMQVDTIEEVIAHLRLSGFVVDEILDIPGPPPEEGQEYIELTNFDYAVIRYRWDNSDGNDLDTRTQIIAPFIEDRVGWNVGWSVSGNGDGDYLQWGGDNTEAGVEAVLLDLKLLREESVEHEDIFNIALRSFWYDSVDLGFIELELETYLGGTMEASGYDFINVGGELVETQKVQQQIFIQESMDIAGQTIGYIQYDKGSNKTYLIKQDYVDSPLSVVYEYPTILNRYVDIVFKFKDYGSHSYKINFRGQHEFTHTLSHNEDYYAYLNSLLSTYDPVHGEVISVESATHGGTVTQFVYCDMPSVTYNSLTKSFYITTGGHDDLKLKIMLNDGTDSVLTELDVIDLPTAPNGSYVYNIESSPILQSGVSFKYTFTFTGYDGNVHEYINAVPSEVYLDFEADQVSIITHDQVSQYYHFFARVDRFEAGEVTAMYYYPDNPNPAVHSKKLTTNTMSTHYESSGDLYKYFDTGSDVECHVLFVDSAKQVIPLDLVYFNNVSGVKQIGKGISRFRVAGGINANTHITKPIHIPDSLPTTLRHLNMFRPAFGNDNHRPADVYSKVKDWDVSNLTSLYLMFYDCNNFNVDISGWDVSNVRDLSWAFYGCTSLDVDLSAWDVQQVLNAKDTFVNAPLMQARDYSTWYMPYAFENMSAQNITGERLPKKFADPNNPFSINTANEFVIIRDDNSETLEYRGDPKDQYLDRYGYRWISTTGTDRTTDTSMSLSSQDDKASHATLFKLSTQRNSPSVRLSARYSGLQLSNFPTMPEINNLSFYYHSGACFYPEYLPENITSLEGMYRAGATGIVGGIDLAALWDTSHVTNMINLCGTKQPLIYSRLMMRKWDTSQISQRPVPFSGFSPEGYSDVAEPVWGTSGGSGEARFGTNSSGYYFLIAKKGSPISPSDLFKVETRWIDGSGGVTPVSKVVGSDSDRIGRFDISQCELITYKSDRLAEVMGITDKENWYFYTRWIGRYGFDASGQDYANITIEGENSNLKIRF